MIVSVMFDFDFFKSFSVLLSILDLMELSILSGSSCGDQNVVTGRLLCKGSCKYRSNFTRPYCNNS